ncbi:hypothetical protein F511_40600 [Dorcoceras hygrometricum]|uniref:Uncharacterized protein n=1 Tax=Dorcoceras hygrometricum TaxID=472368 RepID=A0A2Z7AIA6_9LAMI|nr:hypothetical protein F511_40600 [Dorcoceras hygrometricum]
MASFVVNALQFFANASVIAGMIVSTLANWKLVITMDVFVESFQLPTEGMVSFSGLPAKAVAHMKVLFSAFDAPFKPSNKKKDMKIEYSLLHEIVAKSLSTKAEINLTLPLPPALSPADMVLPVKIWHHNFTAHMPNQIKRRNVSSLTYDNFPGGHPSQPPNKNKDLKVEYRLLHDIVAKSLCTKAGSFDVVMSEKLEMMVAIIRRFEVFSGEAGEGRPGESVALHPFKVLNHRSVLTYMKKNQAVPKAGEASKKSGDTTSEKNSLLIVCSR